MVAPRVSLILSEEVTSSAPTTAFMVEGGCGLLTYPLDNFKTEEECGLDLWQELVCKHDNPAQMSQVVIQVLGWSAAGPRFKSSGQR